MTPAKIFLVLGFAATTALAESAYRTQRIAWLSLGGVLFTYLILEIRAVRALTARSWGGCAVLGLFAAAAFPLLLVGGPLLGKLSGTPMGPLPKLSDDGLTLSLASALRPFSSLFWMLCSATAVLLGSLKFVFLRPLSLIEPGMGAMVRMMMACFLSTTVFLLGVTLEPAEMMARLTRGVQRSLTSTTGKSGPLSETAKQLVEPLRKHYQEVGEQVRELEQNR